VKAVVVHAAGDVRVDERPDPQPGPGEVLLAMEWGGICGSDISYFRHGSTGTAVIRHPLVLGHEVAGRVSAVGPDVDGIAEGDAATVHPATLVGDPHLPDRIAGRTNLHPCATSGRPPSTRTRTAGSASIGWSAPIRSGPCPTV
jgi:L-idonate 5-dehydrogenase